MPEATSVQADAAQMSFAEQMVHLAQEQPDCWRRSANSTEGTGEAGVDDKKDVIAFVRQSFDQNDRGGVQLDSGATYASYQSFEGQMTGLELVMFALDHTTHHRALGGDVSARQGHHARGVSVSESRAGRPMQQPEAVHRLSVGTTDCYPERTLRRA
jgi:hypothetical protein